MSVEAATVSIFTASLMVVGLVHSKAFMFVSSVLCPCSSGAIRLISGADLARVHQAHQNLVGCNGQFANTQTSGVEDRIHERAHCRNNATFRHANHYFTFVI